VLAGQVVRVVTTGGGGWGDPLEREPELVLHDVVEGRVSLEAAREAYGVVLSGSRDDCTLDESATMRLRTEMKAGRATALPAIDRGKGYEQMLRGECAPRMRS
jgi:N-methylhydantoinase B